MSDSPKAGDVEKMQTMESLTCTFCGRQVHVTVSVGDHGAYATSVLHAMPECPDFVKMDADEYLAHIRLNQTPSIT